MTIVTYQTERVPVGIVFELKASGHAGYKREGDDPVCAACSVLVQALAAALCERKPAIAGKIYLEDAEGAEASVWYLAGDPLDAECAEAMFGVAIAGFEMLEKNFPENICVTGEKRAMN